MKTNEKPVQTSKNESKTNERRVQTNEGKSETSSDECRRMRDECYSFIHESSVTVFTSKRTCKFEIKP